MNDHISVAGHRDAGRSAVDAPSPDENQPRVPQRAGRIRRTPIWILVQVFCRIVNSAIFDLKTYGVYNLPQTGGVLVVSNHQSYLDPCLLSSSLPRTISYLAKAELFRVPGFAWLIRSLNAFPVAQGSGDVGAMKESIARLQTGHLLNVYPEGSRTADGEIAQLEKGVALLIRRARVPVVPVVITGSFEAWPKGRRLPRPWPIRILIGPPMNDLWRLDRDAILAQIDKTLRVMYQQLRTGQIPPTPKRPAGR
jgi:1-acyl-sn-glycerol-3-phosphate acyltransferase